ncbi:MAG: hypothetical protein O2800_01640 [Planctomycetota bacterium]|nr:hypothetical protein [Planctomycetota bacterium]
MSVIALCALAGTIAIAAPDVTIACEPTSVEAGEPFTVIVTLANEAGSTLQRPALPLAMGAFDLLGIEQPDGHHLHIRMLTWETGTVTLPLFPLHELRQDGTQIEIEPPTTTISVTTLLATEDGLTTMQPHHGVLSIPFEVGERTIFAISSVVSIIAAAIGVWMLRPRPLVIVTPDESALSDLALLASRELVTPEEVQMYWFDLSLVIRRYVEGRFGLRAPECTTNEFIAQAHDRLPVDAGVRSTLAKLLAFSDRVKFACHRATPADGQQALSFARQFVIATRLPTENTSAVSSGTEQESMVKS